MFSLDLKSSGFIILPNSSYRYVIPYLTGNIQDDVRVVTLNDPMGI